MTELTRAYNSVMPIHYTPPRRGRKKCATPLGDVVRAATEAGLTYGQYVALNDPVLRASKPNKENGWTHPNRTLIEALDTELTNPETRAEWLNDPKAKQILADRENEAERRVQRFFDELEKVISRRSRHGRKNV